MEKIDQLFQHFLQDIYYAERQILKSLPKMAQAAESEKLRQALLEHRDETEGQVERLEQVFQTFGQRARSVTCEAIKGIMEEGEELMEMFQKGAVRDAGIVANAQAVEHYEMARYGALIAWAKTMGNAQAVTLLQATLDEEKTADQKLTALAESEVNQKANAPQAA